jgi:tetratricopeptide (TPR) repeat protein
MNDFEVGLSFAGEQRELVAVVADRLAAALGRDHVFYDCYHEEQLARPDLDVYLQKIYLEHTKLIVVFLCKDYERKEWPGLEWRLVRDLIKRKSADRIMLIRTDEAPVSGLLGIDGYLDAGNLGPDLIAERILKRLRTLPTSPRPQPRLPPRPPYFVGRERELADMLASVLASHPLPIPLLGPPGVGKSNLALMCLHSDGVVERFGGCRYFVRCNSASNLDALIAVTAAALPSSSNEPEISEDLVIQELARAPSLLVLDNTETPWESDIKAVEDFLARLASLPGLALVVALRGNDRPKGTHWGKTILLQPFAIQLARKMFLEVAGDDYRDDPHLDRLIDAVGGLPLAVILLAYEADALPGLEELWLRWESEGTGLLQHAGEHTVEVSIMVSVRSRRMHPRAERLASLLALLPDGAEVEDLSKVVGEDVLSAAAALRKTGLVDAGTRRLRLLAVVREVMLRNCPPSPSDRDRLMAGFLELAKLADSVGADGEAEAVRRLTPEIGNLTAILSAALESTDPTPALLAVLSFTKLQQFLGLGGYALIAKAVGAANRAGLGLLTAKCQFALGQLAARREQNVALAAYEDALSRYRQMSNKLGEADCLMSLGFLAFLRADLGTAEARYRESLALYAGSGHVRGRASCVESLADIAVQRAEYGTARSHYEEALRLYRESDLTLGEASATAGLATIAFLCFNQDNAASGYEEARHLYRHAGSVAGESSCARGLGDIALQRADYEAARTRYEEALDLDRRSGSVLGEASCNEKLGDVAVRRLDFDTAGSCYQEARAIYQRVGDALGEAGCVLSLGAVALKTGDLRTAEEKITEALGRFQAEASAYGEASCLLGFGRLAVAKGDASKAVVTFERARAICHRLGNFAAEATCLTDLADLARREGKAPVARELLGQALELYERISDRFSVGSTHGLLAGLARSRSEWSIHVEAARRAWEVIHRSDLIAELTAEEVQLGEFPERD